MDDLITNFILNKSFPCIMAKAVVSSGFLKVVRFKNSEEDLNKALSEIYQFVDDYRKNPSKLRSFILILDDESFMDFDLYERNIWKILSALNTEDMKNYSHDPRVSSDSMNSDYSFSLKEEAFFILGLHPKSPRFARRFIKPALVFNLHQQFEEMRLKGTYQKIRNLIRSRDVQLQGSVNPMLNDFGVQSEVYQYSGKEYTSPLLKSEIMI